MAEIKLRTDCWFQLHHVGAQYSQRTSEFSLAESRCADTGNNDSGVLQQSVRGVEPACVVVSEMALFHMKPRASPAATNLTAGKTPLEGSADLPTSGNFRGILLSGRRVIFK